MPEPTPLELAMVDVIDAERAVKAIENRLAIARDDLADKRVAYGEEFRKSMGVDKK